MVINLKNITGGIFMLKIEDILREDFDWENVEIDEEEFDEL